MTIESGEISCHPISPVREPGRAIEFSATL